MQELADSVQHAGALWRLAGSAAVHQCRCDGCLLQPFGDAGHDDARAGECDDLAGRVRRAGCGPGRRSHWRAEHVHLQIEQFVAVDSANSHGGIFCASRFVRDFRRPPCVLPLRDGGDGQSGVSHRLGALTAAAQRHAGQRRNRECGGSRTRQVCSFGSDHRNLAVAASGRNTGSGGGSACGRRDRGGLGSSQRPSRTGCGFGRIDAAVEVPALTQNTHQVGRIGNPSVNSGWIANPSCDAFTAQRFFLYEYLTGGGTFSSSDPNLDAGGARFGPSLVREGAAMIAALARDFLAVPGASIVLLRDARLADLPLPECPQILIHGAQEEQEAFSQLAATSEGTIIIAPEQNRALLQRTRWAEAAGARLLCPDSAFVAIASDKNLTVDLLRQHGVPVPLGCAIAPGQRLPQDFPYPAVLKPADGAGSIGVQLVAGPQIEYDATILGTSARLEALCPGAAASVAVLCGPGGHQPLPPCSQRLSDDGHFRYLGGSVPIEPPLADRAQRLALAALACFPPTRGYVGVDLVLGAADDGSGDVVIEVNPRLTTSYVGLRRLLQTNLAAAMIRAAAGCAVELRGARQRVEFRAEGQIL